MRCHKKIQIILSKITRELLIHYENRPEGEMSPSGVISLLGGISGVSIYFYYMSRYSNDETLSMYGDEILSEIFENLNNGFSFPTFCEGIAGIGCFVRHLATNGFIDDSNKDVMNVYDNYLYKQMMNFLDDRNYDYLHGAVGIGLYFLSTDSGGDKTVYLKDLVEGLDKISHHQNGNMWWDFIDNNDKNIKINFSLSHGMASIVSFLYKCLKKGICTEKTENMLKSSIKFMQLNSNENITGYDNQEGYFGYFPSFIWGNGDIRSSRLAWCYGDPGIATALYLASKVIDDSELENKMISVLVEAASCRSLEKAGVKDAGICHGTAGLALIFYRMYLNTDMLEFKEAYEFWIEETIKMAGDKESLDFRSYRPENKSLKEYGLLEGIAGIGLVLLSICLNEEPDWDEMLLLH